MVDTAIDLDTLREQIKDKIQLVKDPEIPPISVLELGVITEIDIQDANNVMIRMTPTFAGCPAVNVMQDEVRERVSELPIDNVEVIVDFQTSWDSNRITDEGLKKLKQHGLAIPKRYKNDFDPAQVAEANCPNCGSSNTFMYSPFGPTLCRSLHRCNACGEAFEQFKPL